MKNNEISVSPEMKIALLGYKDEVLALLSSLESSNAQLKEVILAASDVSKVPKRIVSKFFKAAYASKVKELTDEADVIGFLNE